MLFLNFFLSSILVSGVSLNERNAFIFSTKISLFHFWVRVLKIFFKYDVIERALQVVGSLTWLSCHFLSIFLFFFLNHFFSFWRNNPFYMIPPKWQLWEINEGDDVVLPSCCSSVLIGFPLCHAVPFFLLAVLISSLGWITNSNFSCVRTSSSSSSYRAASTDIHDLLSPLLPIVHRLWQVFRATSRILT